MRKQNIPFPLIVNTQTDTTGIAGSFTAEAKLAGTADPFVALPGTFTELGNGAYELMVTFATVNTYDVRIVSTEPGIDSETFTVTIGKSSVDDVYDALVLAGTDIATIKAKVATLDDADIELIKTGVNDTLALLQEVNTMMGDTELAGVTSLKELLIAIGESETAQTGLVNAIKDTNTALKRILMGQEQFLEDGTTPNPHYQATNVELKSLITTTAETLTANITAAQTAILADATATKELLLTKFTAVQTIVDGNKALLEDSGYGLAAIKTALDAITTNTSGGTTTIIDAINDAEHGLAAIMAKANSILSAVQGVDTKLSAVATDVTTIKNSQSGSKRITVSF